MISIDPSFISTDKMTDRSVVVSCLSGFSNPGTGLPGISAVRPASAVSPLMGAQARERSARPTQALEAAAAVQASAYAFAAAGAGSRKQATHHHTMWAFRGLEPWSDPA